MRLARDISAILGLMSGCALAIAADYGEHSTALSNSISTSCWNATPTKMNIKSYVLQSLVTNNSPPAAPDTNTTTPYRNYGILLFRAFDLIDIAGPMEVLQFTGYQYPIHISLIAASLSPVTSEPLMPSMNPQNSSVWPTLNPTHTFETAPDDLDVLIVPGGPGMRAPENLLKGELEFIREQFGKVKHFVTICTGSGLAARAGVLDGRRVSALTHHYMSTSPLITTQVTTNKRSWPGIIPMGPKTTWVPRARWVEDESAYPPIWSSSGVTSGFDLMFNLVEKFYNSTTADNIQQVIEYVRNRDKDNDPFGRNETEVVPGGQ